MGYLVLGFILGVAVSWFWQTQFSGVPAFKQLMQKELAVNGQLGSVTLLKKKLEIMEKRLYEMEKTPEIFVEEKQELPAEKITAVTDHGDKVISVSRPAKVTKIDRRKNREQVLKMWKEGSAVTDIASKTNLGKGEVELIISLQENIKEGRCSI